jgi:hypothetical protein
LSAIPFRQPVKVADTLRHERVRAELHGVVLRVTLSKKLEAQPKRIAFTARYRVSV